MILIIILKLCNYDLKTRFHILIKWTPHTLCLVYVIINALWIKWTSIFCLLECSKRVWFL